MPEASLIIKHFSSHLPELTMRTRHHRAGGHSNCCCASNTSAAVFNRNGTHTQCTLMSAYKQHVECFTLCWYLYTKMFAGAGAVFIIVYGLQSYSPLSSWPLCNVMQPQCSIRASFNSNAAFSISSGSTNICWHLWQRQTAMSFFASQCG